MFVPQEFLDFFFDSLCDRFKIKFMMFQHFSIVAAGGDFFDSERQELLVEPSALRFHRDSPPVRAVLTA